MKTGAVVLAEMLDAYEVSHVFHVPAVLRRTMVEIEALTGIKRIRPHGEKPAAYMADGYARASGKPGVCMAQVVGALNLAAGLRDAHLAHSPVIAMTGGRDPSTKFRKVYQEVDDVPAFEPVTKFNATIDSVERFPDMLRQAFRVATTGSPGPVHLQFRGNEGQLDLQSAEMDQRVESTFVSVPPFRPRPDDDTLVAALSHISRADRPVIVAGGGVRLSAAGAALPACLLVGLARQVHQEGPEGLPEPVFTVDGAVGQGKRALGPADDHPQRLAGHLEEGLTDETGIVEHGVRHLTPILPALSLLLRRVSLGRHAARHSPRPGRPHMCSAPRPL